MCFFFFMQKTAYEMRISDWSSDVCSSDLTIRLQQQEEKIDMGVFIDWQRNPAIGETGIAFSAENPRKAFYDDRYKLLVCFPASINDQQIYKNAPFDVTKSQLENTHFNRWDEIKHNILLNRSEEHTSELQSLMRISYAVFCLKQKKT